MVRTQIQFTETQLQALRARSQRDQLSVSELVRRAVDAWTQTEPAISPARQ